MSETRRSFHEKLEDIHSELVRIGASVVENIPRATRVLLDMDLEGADLMILGDDEIDARCLDVEERIFDLIALQAPVATDLRELVAALKITADIERSADGTVNICKAARRIYGHDLNPKMRGMVGKMSDQAQHLLAFAMEAYDERDASKAAAVEDMDNYLDSLHRQLIQVIFESHAAGTIDLQVAVQMAVVARFYERLGDHAVNVSEKVRYIVTGWKPEHVGVVRHKARQEYTPPSGIPRPDSDLPDSGIMETEG